MNYLDKFVYAMFGFAALLIICVIPYTIFFDMPRMNNLKADCIASGGYPYKPWNTKMICIKKEAIIPRKDYINE